MTIEVLRCPRHASFWAVAINDFRITPSKCCGAWSKAVRWKIDGRMLIRLTPLASSSDRT